MDGGWTAWSTESRCEQVTGETCRCRTRTCSQPSPQNGGRLCQGAQLEISQCEGKHTRQMFLHIDDTRTSLQFTAVGHRGVNGRCVRPRVAKQCEQENELVPIPNRKTTDGCVLDRTEKRNRVPRSPVPDKQHGSVRGRVNSSLSRIDLHDRMDSIQIGIPVRNLVEVVFRNVDARVSRLKINVTNV